MVFGAARESRIQAEGVPPRTTGVRGGFDMIGTLELAIALQPEARALFVLSGVANMFDEDYFQQSASRSTGWIAAAPGDPRTLGVTLRGQY
jgi:hypothetical protein